MQVHHHVSKSEHQPRSVQQSMPILIVSVLGLLAIICTTFATIQTASAHAAAACTGPYTTVADDTACQHGNGASVQTIASNNGIRNIDLIYAGQKPYQGNSASTPTKYALAKPVPPAPAKPTPPAPAKPAKPTPPAPAKPAKPTPPAPAKHSKPAKPAPAKHSKPAKPAKPATSINGMIDQVFGVYAPAAKRIATCESSMNPKATNTISIGGSHAEGLFQILYPSTWKGTSQASQSPYNARANIKAAHDIFVRDGYSWREWACQP